MSYRITVKLDKELIESAKQFAKEQNCSLSSLVENHFKLLLEEHQNNS